MRFYFDLPYNLLKLIGVNILVLINFYKIK